MTIVLLQSRTRWALCFCAGLSAINLMCAGNVAAPATPTYLAADLVSTSPDSALVKGLYCEFYKGADTIAGRTPVYFQTADTVRTYNPHILFQTANYADSPNVTVFSGYLLVNQDSSYTMSVAPRTRAELTIGGKVVANDEPVLLRKGYHAVRLQCVKTALDSTDSIRFVLNGAVPPDSSLWRVISNDPMDSMAKIYTPRANDVFHVGDSLIVTWATNASRLSKVYLSISVDNQATFCDISSGGYATSDPGWGRFAWSIPDSVEDTYHAWHSMVTDSCTLIAHNYGWSTQRVLEYFKVEPRP